LSWYSPKPRQKPKRLPRRRPIKTIPSGIGDKGIVGNWLMYYLKGGDHLHDFSPGDNHGEIIGAKWISTKRGWALDLDGVDDHTSVPYADSLNLSNELTVTAWVNRGTDTYGGIFEKSIGESTNTQYLLFIENNRGSMRVVKDGTSYTVLTDTNLPENGFVYLVGRYDGSELSIWRNGEKQTDTTSVSAPIDSGVGKSWIGALFTGGFYYLNGVIALVRVYNIAKSASWIKRRFERTKGIFGL